MFHRKLLIGMLAGMIGLAAAVSPQIGQAHDTPFGAWGHKWAHTPMGRLVVGNLGRLLVLDSELDLSWRQRKELQAILFTHRSEILANVKNVWEKRTALRDVTLSEKPDEAAIRKAADNLGRAIGDTAVMASKIRGQLAPVFTKEQRELLKKFRADCDHAVARFFTEMASKGR